MKKWINKIEDWLLWALPVVVFFSYLPVFYLGMNETMYFELSIPLIWLLIFGLLSLRKIPAVWRSFTPVKRLIWLALPVYATISIIWSSNKIRGILTAGVLWLIMFSILNILSLKLRRDKIEKLLELHMYAGVGAGLVCLLQCFMDVIGVDRAATGLCAGCTYQTIGFPHPNGFAIEPQFMGNLLILPCVISLLFLYKDTKYHESKSRISLDLVLTIFLMMSLFITFSRGAIYAFMLAVICFLVYACVKLHRFSTLWVLPLIALSFGGGLLLQGWWAALSPTNEGFTQGITRSIEQMTLGKVDFNEDIEAETSFDGYIEESTDIRLNMNEIAIKTWWNNNQTIGVGLGGAGVAMHKTEPNLLSREIVQNEYLQVLLELGMVGVAILLIDVILVLIGLFKRHLEGFAFFGVLLIAYLATMGFFSGFPNVLHIYLMTPVLYLLFQKRSYVKIG